MTISQAISSHIPYLRRFARALTGSQASGDAYVLATLEAVVADPSGFTKTPISENFPLPALSQTLGVRCPSTATSTKSPSRPTKKAPSAISKPSLCARASPSF